MSLEVVLTDETFAAAIATELPIAEVCLHMRPNVLSTAKDLATFGIQARPLSGGSILFTDISLDFFGRDASVLETRIDFHV